MTNTRRFPKTLARAQREQLGVQLRVEPDSLAYLTHPGERACGGCGFHVCACPKPSSKPRDYLEALLGGDAWQRLLEASARSIEHTVLGFGPSNKCAQAGCEVCNRPQPIATYPSLIQATAPGSYRYKTVATIPAKPAALVVDGVELPPGWFYDEDNNEWVSDDERRWISVGDDGGYDANVDDEIDMGPDWGGDVETVYGVLDAVMACYGFDRVNKWYHAVVGGIEVAVWPGAGSEWIADNDRERRMYDSPWPAVAFALGKTPQELYGA